MSVDEFLQRLERVKKSGKGWTSRCPGHDDKQASLSVSEGDDGRVLVNCFADCSASEIVTALGLQLRDLFPDRGGGASSPATTRSTGQQSFAKGCTLAEYAAAKRLPVPFLESLGVSEIRFQGSPAVRFPYLDEHGEEVCVRFRVSMRGDLRVRTKAGNKHHLYGLNRLQAAREAGYVIVVEGESDTQTLWQHGYPALGLPGANGWNEDRDAPHLEEIPTVYVLIEPDRGGEAVLRWLAASRISERVRLVVLDAAKDVSELHLNHPDSFGERLEAALREATPWAEHEQVATSIRASTAWERCRELAQEPRILDRFATDLVKAGLTGESRSGKLLYLILTSRFLARPVSAAVKGPSAGGKSFLVETVCSFFPSEAYYALTAMSEHALAYGTEPLSHRFLILYEAAGMEGDFASYIIRSLLSEGRVRYETVEKTSEGLAPRLIEREGPTGLLTTTTKVALHPENETRLLSIPITDTPAQTRDVLRALADDTFAPPDLGRWVALQEWIASTGQTEVSIPFAHDLAELVPPIAVRLRRDFSALLSLIRAHALLQQATRERDQDGRIVATVHDYSAVRDLVGDLVAEGVEATVPPVVRETVQAVIAAGLEEGISVAKLALALKIDKAAASRRWSNAKARGHLKNLETGRGKPARIVLADPLPEDVEVLPTVEVLTDRCTVDRDVAGVKTPPPPCMRHTAEAPQNWCQDCQANGWVKIP
ncbi:MAG: hypothetical protein WKF41_06835 [Gaiellaceae bacterium]